MDKILLTVPEFLRQYSISRTSFYEQVKQGKLRLIKRGRRSLVAKADADAWVELLRQQSDGGAK
jgi:excisionase family DNA binding protein